MLYQPLGLRTLATPIDTLDKQRQLSYLVATRRKRGGAKALFKKAAPAVAQDYLEDDESAALLAYR